MASLIDPAARNRALRSCRRRKAARIETVNARYPKGRSDSVTGAPLSVWSILICMYQVTGRRAPQTCANSGMASLGKLTPMKPNDGAV